MNKVLHELDAWGCDVQVALARMLNDEDFYIECLNDVVGDSCFVQLGIALKEEDTQGAFDAAHTLKGVLVNTGLTPMFIKIEEIVEPLRKGQIENLMGKYEELIVLNNHLEEILDGSMEG